MKILYLFRSLAVYGGIERVLIEKMNILSSIAGMEVYMITTDQGDKLIPYCVNDNVHLEDLHILFYKQYLYNVIKRLWVLKKMVSQYEFMLSKRLDEIKPNVIVCTTADRIQSIIKIKGNIPLVVESHSICLRTFEYSNYWLVRKIYRRYLLNCLARADVVVALTERDAIEWRKFHRYVKVIPNIVNVYKGILEPYSSKHVIFVGRFDHQKQVKEAILIWSKVHNEHPDWLLDVYGEGEQEDEIKLLANRVGGVIIHPPTNAIFDCYLNSSILISTSLFEPFGLVIPEAMSCGLPVVAYDCPYGPASIIRDGLNGYLIDQGNTDDFSKKICFLIEHPHTRIKMGCSAKLTSSNYCSSNIIPKWLSLFNMLDKKT